MSHKNVQNANIQDFGQIRIFRICRYPVRVRLTNFKCS